MSASADGSCLAIGGGSGALYVISLADGTVQRSGKAHAGAVLSAAWHPRRPLLATGGQDGRLKVWSADRLDEQAGMAAERGWFEHAAFSPSGRHLAAAAGRHVHFLDFDDQSVRTSPEAVSTLAGVAWHGSGKEVLTVAYGGVQRIEAATARVKQTLPWKGSMVALALSPDSRVVACGCQDNEVHFWRLASGRDARMSGYPAKPNRLQWSPDGRILATNGGKDLVLWSFEAGGPEGTAATLLSGHEETVTALAYAPRGQVLISGGQDGRVLFWLPQETRAPAAAGLMQGPVVDVLWLRSRGQPFACASDTQGWIRCWKG